MLMITTHYDRTPSELGALHMLDRNHQQRKKKMVSTLKLGQLVDRRFDALYTKYEGAEIRKLFASGITLIAGGLIKIKHEHLKFQQPRDTGIFGTITLNI